MRLPKLAIFIALAIAVATASVRPTGAADFVWTPSVGDDFNEPLNWTPNGVPGALDRAIFDDPAVTAVLSIAGSQDIDAIRTGDPSGGGSIAITGGTLNILADGSEDSGESAFGDEGELPSSLTLSGDATILYDQPLRGAGLGSDGDGQDFDIGKNPIDPPRATSTLSMSDNSALRVADDLKMGDSGNGQSVLHMRDNAEITIGSGFSLSGVDILMEDNALLVSGNSSAPGDTALGNTNEGYFTMASAGAQFASLVMKDDSKTYVRSLQHRSGEASITLEDNAEYHVFDVFSFAAPDLGVATLTNDSAESHRATHVSQNDSGVWTLNLKDNSTFTVDSALEDGNGRFVDFQGLALSGGNNRGANTSSGGVSTINIEDAATFIIQQDLSMTTASGVDTTAESTLRVTGPDATVEIRGGLLMSKDPFFGDLLDGESTLVAAITGPEHSTIVVGETADIENGGLAVELLGYAPASGESYTVLTAADVVGDGFKGTDFSAAPLDPGLAWDVAVTDTAVALSVTGTATGVGGDYNGDGVVDAADYSLWRDNLGTEAVLANDVIGGVIGAAQYDVWSTNYGRVFAGSVAVPEPSAIGLLIASFSILFARRR